MMRRAREVMYWLGMRAAILQESANCFVCASTHTEQLPKEPMLSHEIPMVLGSLSHKTCSRKEDGGMLLL